MTLQERLNQRTLIEQYCELAVAVLPVYESMLFRLYFSDGYSTLEIGQFLMKHPTTIARRLKKLVEKLEAYRSEEAERIKAEYALRCLIVICPHCGHDGFVDKPYYRSQARCGSCGKPVNLKKESKP